MRKYLLPVLSVLLLTSCQPGPIVYTEPNNYILGKSKLFGGASGEYSPPPFSSTSVQNDDGSIVIAGISASTTDDFANAGNGYASVMKTDVNGKKVWAKKYGTGHEEYFSSIVKTPDGGYLLAGGGKGTTGDFSGNNGNYQAWVVKINSNGDAVWNKTFGGTLDDNFYNIIATNDGNYLLAGVTNSQDGDLTGGGNHGDNEGWIIKIDGSGNKIFSKVFGGINSDLFLVATATNDGGFLLGGETSSNDGDITPRSNFSNANTDCWVVKIDAYGNKQWDKCLGGSDSREQLFNAITTSDGGYIVIANTYSTDGDISGNHGSSDGWIVKLDASGNKVSSRVYGGSGFDDFHSICMTTDKKGYLLVGVSESSDGDLTGAGNHGNADAWVMKIDLSGNKLWSKCFGGLTGEDQPCAIFPGSKGFYFITGNSNSNDGDLSGHHGNGDFWFFTLQAQ